MTKYLMSAGEESLLARALKSDKREITWREMSQVPTQNFTIVTTPTSGLALLRILLSKSETELNKSDISSRSAAHRPWQNKIGRN